LALIALAVDLSDRALIDFERAWRRRSRPINAPGFARDMPALGSTPRRGTRPKRRLEDENGLGKGQDFFGIM
jgi:hypothetical protein